MADEPIADEPIADKPDPDTRTRGDYRLSLPVEYDEALAGEAGEIAVRPIAVTEVRAVATLLLDAYRGTIDDEGETVDEALEAAEFLVGRCEAEHSWVVDGDDELTGVSLVSIVDGIPYIDIVAVAASAKRRGIGRTLVMKSLSGLAAAGWEEAGAAITDGNVASEALFASLGARRIGPWPPE